MSTSLRNTTNPVMQFLRAVSRCDRRRPHTAVSLDKDTATRVITALPMLCKSTIGIGGLFVGCPSLLTTSFSWWSQQARLKNSLLHRNELSHASTSSQRHSAKPYEHSGILFQPVLRRHITSSASAYFLDHSAKSCYKNLRVEMSIIAAWTLCRSTQPQSTNGSVL